MSDTCRRDTLWIPYGYRGHMGSGITIINADGNRDVGCSYYRHPWRGLDRIDPLPAQKNSKDRALPLGITTDVTPLKIVGLNNYT